MWRLTHLISHLSRFFSPTPSIFFPFLISSLILSLFYSYPFLSQYLNFVSFSQHESNTEVWMLHVLQKKGWKDERDDKKLEERI